MNSREWNLMIRMVNDGDPRTEVEKHFPKKKDMEIYDKMNAQLKELRKDNPKAAFWSVESDW